MGVLLGTGWRGRAHRHSDRVPAVPGGGEWWDLVTATAGWATGGLYLSLGWQTRYRTESWHQYVEIDR